MAHGVGGTFHWQKAFCLAMCCLFLGCNAEAAHRKHFPPTPSPTPTPVTTPTPSPTPTPTPTPTPSPTPSTGTPTLEQNLSTASNLDVLDNGLGTGNPGNPFYLNLPNPTGAGNCVILSVTCPYNPARTIQISDNGSNTWTLAGTINNGATMSSVYVALNVQAGLQNITVTFDTQLYDCQFDVSTFYNVAAASALDGSSAQVTSGTGTISSGTLVTTGTGDLVYQYGYDVASPNQGATTLSQITSGSGFNLLSADVFLGTFAQYAVQAAPGPITPSVSLSGSTDSFNTISVALLSASQGTAPLPGIRIKSVQHFWYNRDIAAQFPCSGNLLYLTTAFGMNTSNAVLSTVTDSRGNTWTETEVPSAATPQTFYAGNASTSSDFSFYVPGTDAPANGCSFIVYDIEGADPNPFDTQSFSDLENPVFPGQFQTLSITPSTSNGLVIATLAVDFFAITGYGPGTFDTVTYGHIADNNEFGADTMDNCDGYGHYYNPDTSPINFTWILTGGESFFEEGLAVAFKSGVPGQSP